MTAYNRLKIFLEISALGTDLQCGFAVINEPPRIAVNRRKHLMDGIEMFRDNSVIHLIIVRSQVPGGAIELPALQRTYDTAFS